MSPNAASQHDLDLAPPIGKVPLPLQFEASLLESAEPGLLGWPELPNFEELQEIASSPWRWVVDERELWEDD